MELRPLRDQVIVVTGASSGIGLATAERAAGAGARVVLASRSGGTLDGICAGLNAEGARTIGVEVDVANAGDMQRLAHAAAVHFGRIDTWVNNAGVAIFGRLEEVREEDSRRLFDINFWGVVNGSLAALPYLRRHGGALINVGCVVADAVAPLQGMYSASKHAVKGFTDALRVEVAEVDRAPVAITLIQPPAVDTPYPLHARNYMDREPRLSNSHVEPEHVAQAILAAACHPTRDARVGALAKISTFTAKLIPGVADRLAAGEWVRQQSDELPRNPEGGLWHGVGRGFVHGTAESEATWPRPLV